MSPPLQIPPVPVRYTFAPAVAVSVRRSAPQGVALPSGGPGERPSGNVGCPLKRIVRVRLNDVVAARADTARYASEALAESTTTSNIPIRLPNDDTPFPPTPLFWEGAPARPPARAGRLRPGRGCAGRRCGRVRATDRRGGRRRRADPRHRGQRPPRLQRAGLGAVVENPGQAALGPDPARQRPLLRRQSTTCRPTASPRGSAPCSTRADSSSWRPGPARRRPSRLRSRGRCRPRARPRCSSGTPTRPPCSTRQQRRACATGTTTTRRRRA